MSTEQKLQTISTNNTIIAENEQRVYDAGVELGKSVGQSEFWDVFQNYGNRTNYDTAFSSKMAWSDETFNPKYPLVPQSASSMFDKTKIKKAPKLLEIDFSQATKVDGIFIASDIEELGVVDFSSAKALYRTFYQTKSLIKIAKFIFAEQNTFTETFHYASRLTELTAEGIIANNIHFGTNNNLTQESLMSVINVLKDYSEDTSGTTYKITLGSTNLAKLTDEEKAIATQKGWTLA